MTADELTGLGYVAVTSFSNGRQAAINPYLFTCAIVADFGLTGYVNRWCYHTFNDAFTALKAWDGEGEPEGWHRHIPSHRRRDEDGNEYVEP